MSENWVDEFNAAMLKFLQTYEPKAVEILSYSEDTSGGCETCGPDIEVDFRYACGDKKCHSCTRTKVYPYIRGHLYSYWGSLGGIIESITSD